MRITLKNIGKRTVYVAVAALIAGTGITAGVFAAIPDSNTGTIAGCRSTVSGALRAIDAQAGGTCGLLEAPISMLSPATGTDNASALLRLKPNPADADNYVIDTTRSRNIVKADTIADPNPENTGYRAICVEVKFDPEVTILTGDQGVGGGGASLQFLTINQSATAAAEIEYMCESSDYNAVAYLNPYSTPAVPQSIWFSK